MKQQVKGKQLTTGDYLSERQFYRVADPMAHRDVNGEYVAKVVSQDGLTINISHGIIENSMWSADQFEEVKQVNRTELAQKLSQAYGGVFTVNFNKQVKNKEVKETLLNILKSRPGGRIQAYSEIEAQFNAKCPDVTRGEERTLIGYLVSNDNLGRSQVVDLEIPEGQHRLRLVDHRTLNWLIYQGVKYVVKK